MILPVTLIRTINQAAGSQVHMEAKSTFLQQCNHNMCYVGTLHIVKKQLSLFVLFFRKFESTFLFSCLQLNYSWENCSGRCIKSLCSQKKDTPSNLMHFPALQVKMEGKVTIAAVCLLCSCCEALKSKHFKREMRTM